MSSKKHVSKTELWHKRLGHVNERGLVELSKENLLCGDKVKKLDFCKPCVYGKSCRVKFNKGKQRTYRSLDYIHADLWGPARNYSHSEARYFLSIFDDYSRKLWVFIQKAKDGTFENFKSWKTLVENQKLEGRPRGFGLIMVLSFARRLSKTIVMRLVLHGT